MTKQLAAVHTRRAAAVLLVVLLVGGGLLAGAYFQQLSPLLVDWTGETELKQQLVAVVSASREEELLTEDLAPVRNVGMNPYGVNTFLQQEVEQWKVEKSLDMLRDAGVGWIRQQMPWWDIETLGKGQYINQFGQNTWDKYDRFVDGARRRDIQILARLDDPPDWSRTWNVGDHHGPPDRLEDYGDFVSAFVTHFKGRIKYYQIWNEPNIFPEWGHRPISAEDYVALLKVGYTRVKQADPDAVVVAAALAATDGMPDGSARDDLTYLTEMYEAGARDYFDVMSVNGYGLWSGPNDRRLDRINFSRARLVREIMVRNGDAAKPLWMSEVGWHAAPADALLETPWGRVTREEQALYTVKGYQRAQQEWPWMGVVFYWHFRMVHGDDPNKPMFYWSMLEPDFAPNPVYSAYREMATAPPVLNYGQHQENHRAIAYEGPWERVDEARAAAGGYVTSATPDARLSFTFQGTELDLVALRAPGAGRVAVTVDGSGDAANRVPSLSGGRAIIDLAADEPTYQQRIPIASGLPAGTHRVVLEVAASEGPVAVDAFVVRDESPGYPRLWLAGAAAVALCAVVGLGLTLGYLRRNRAR